ncbi:flagellin, partial [Paracraurococcus ruber]|uniref:flagellin n=1 Tax=Paracraurococcus ruber TaxID=77675 RepID=UPI0023D92941
RRGDPAAAAVADRLRMDSAADLAVADGLTRAREAARLGLAALDGMAGTLAELRAAVIQAQPAAARPEFALQRAALLVARLDALARDAGFDGVNLLAGQSRPGQQTQAVVLQGRDGGTLIVGGAGIAALNASAAGLGLDAFDAAGQGVTLDFGTPPAGYFAGTTRRITLRSDNAGSGVAGNPGREWRFDLRPGAGGAPQDEVTAEADGNPTEVVTIVAVGLPADATAADALRALAAALAASGFTTRLDAEGGRLRIAGNNLTQAGGVDLSGLDPWTAGYDYLGSAQASGAAAAGATTLPLTFLPADLAGSPVGSEISGAAFARNTQITGVNAQAGTVTIDRPLTAALAAGTVVGVENRQIGTPEASGWTGPEAALAVVEAASRKLGTMAATLGAAMNRIEARQAMLRRGADALLAGAGYLADADIPKVRAAYLAAQVRQQLATQSLGIANRAPQLLLRLFA